MPCLFAFIILLTSCADVWLCCFSWERGGPATHKKCVMRYEVCKLARGFFNDTSLLLILNKSRRDGIIIAQCQNKRCDPEWGRMHCIVFCYKHMTSSKSEEQVKM